MDSEKSPESEPDSKDLFIACIILATMIILSILLAWRFSPSHQVFSEDFENAERNQQYLCCSSFTIDQGKLRITIDQTYYGCAVSLPQEYGNFTFNSSVYSVQDFHDGSINFLFRQGDNGGYEIQFRPNKQQINFIETTKNSNQEFIVKYTTGWIPTPDYILGNSENKIRLTVTRNAIDFWFNDVLIYRKIDVNGLSPDLGLIKIGVGAAETSGIAYEFDDIEIYSESMYSRWLHDFMAIKGIDR